MQGGAYLDNAAIFLVQTLFGLVLMALMLRCLLQYVRADYYNPVVQVLVRVTDPLLRPLRGLLPRGGRLDPAAIALMVLLAALQWLLIFLMIGVGMPLAAVLVLGVAALLGLLFDTLFWAIVISAVLSWVNPDPRHPLVRVLYQLTEPVLAPARQLLPPFSGIDLSPILVLIALQLCGMLLQQPIYDLGMNLVKPS